VHQHIIKTTDSVCRLFHDQPRINSLHQCTQSSQPNSRHLICVNQVWPVRGWPTTSARSKHEKHEY